jgi:small subunit ribosomal protein S16
MPAKIRLQRHGKKGFAFFHIVIADGRAPRDGKFIEKLGTYNPNTNPATIELDFDRTLYWLQNGAQPTDTTRAILSYKGVMYKNHLLKGIAKGALTQEIAEARFEKWLSEKEGKIATKVQKLSGSKEEDKRSRLAAEKAKDEAKAKAIVAKQNAATAQADEVTEAPSEETPAAEA